MVIKKIGLFTAGVVNSVLLAIVYFTAAALTWLAARISGKRFLEHEEGWQELSLTKKPRREYYRQF